MTPVARSSTRAASDRARLRRAVVGLALLAASGAGIATARAEPSKQACIDAATHGQKVRDDGRWLEAKASFLTCASVACPGIVRAECARWLADIDAQLPSVVLGARSAAGADLTAVRVTMDGQPFVTELDGRPRGLDPGAHHFRFEDRGGRITAADVVVRAGESARVVVATFADAAPEHAPPLALGPAPAPSAPSSSEGRSTVPLWIAGGLTLAAAGLATAMVIYAHGEDDVVRGSCSPRCSDGALRPLRTSLAVANVAMVTSVLSLGAFGYFVWRY